MSSAIRLRILQLAILLPSFSPMCSIVAAATVPDPPPQICLGSKCITTTGPKMKWHPGHYAQSDFYLTPSTLSQTYADIDRMAAVVDGSGKPRFKGYAVQFHWADIEPTTQGAYNATMKATIDSVLSRLSSNYKYNGVITPFRLILKVRVESQGGTSGIPAYINSGISGQGSDAIPASGSAGAGGYAAALWRAPVMTAYIKMLNYLGSQYDSNPNVEVLVALEETSIAYDGPPPDYSGTAFYTQLQNLVKGLTAWPTTIKTFYPNFGPNNTDQAWTNTAIDFAYTQSWAAGGPDLLVPNGESWGEVAFYNGSGGTGKDYRGLMPSVIGVEDDVYLWTSQTSAADESYAYNTLHPSHMLWMIFPQGTYASIAGKASQWWESGTIPALQAVNFRIAASALSCPTNFHGACNVN